MKRPTKLRLAAPFSASRSAQKEQRDVRRLFVEAVYFGLWFKNKGIRLNYINGI